MPSHAGYRTAQELLASQGYVTVSIAANGINGQDDLAEDGGAQARSSLVRLHLARWADWARRPATAPAAVRAVAPADLSRVLLVGHSRGGEGVNRAALDSLYAPPADQDGYHGPTRWKIRGTVLIGPTVFGQNPAPDVPSATILPGCDGDVSDLQGEIYVDGTRGVSRERLCTARCTWWAPTTTSSTASGPRDRRRRPPTTTSPTTPTRCARPGRRPG
ncbi:hypothetical protein SALBM135S_09177 [Streptomyces alboniger]